MEINTQKKGDTVIFFLQGEMDLYNSHMLKEHLSKIKEQNPKKIIINMKDVPYIDSSGIGALIYVYSSLKKEHIDFAITGIDGTVKRVIELTKLSEYFPIE
ncbi:STAS domain-containing protein [Spirochaetia bacterium 38H-sp]|uniref:Anti-sigma factor antagonist n=1 Tax=Rarispira pelagica TaxID=3141764 RepID=A0ABU9UBE6_9SPIR